MRLEDSSQDEGTVTSSSSTIEDKLITIDTTGALRVTFEETDGTAIPVDQLIPRLVSYLGTAEAEGKLRIEVIYRDENGNLVPLDHKVITAETMKARIDEMELAQKAWLTSSLVDHMNKRLAELTDMLATDSKPASSESDAPSDALQKRQI